MTSDIAFLEDLREDLLEVAEFDAGRHEVTPRARDRAPLMTRRRIVILSMAAYGVFFLVYLVHVRFLPGDVRELPPS